MAKVEGLARVERAIKQLAAAFYDSPRREDNSVIVGYTASYAVYVHETFEPAEGAIHKARAPGKQGKYLEQPARKLNNDGTLANIVVTAMKRKLTLVKGLLLAGTRLQR
ncbi:unnamed protein product, partial [marine sediment metagenome]